MVTTTLIVWVLFAHWFSDFMLQSRWMGTNKSHNWEAMFSHIAVYYVSLAVFMVPVLGHAAGIMFALLNALAHLLTDTVTSRASSWAWKNKHEHTFWSVIGFDQFLHVAVLLISLPLFILS